MPIDVRWLKPLINRYTSTVATSRGSRQKLIQQWQAFFDPDFAFDVWEKTLAQAKLAQPKLGVVQFSPDEIANAFYAFGTEPTEYVLISSDGSQIMPDRHKPALYGMIHVACVCFVYGYAQAQKQESLLQMAVRECDEPKVQLLGDDDLFTAEGELKPSGEISLERDLLEIEVLAERAKAFYKANVRVFAIVDGSIMPFTLLNERLSDNVAIEKGKRVAKALNTLSDCGAVIAGYIDRPNSNAIVKTIAIGQGMVPDRDMRLMLGGVYDRFLFESQLPPASRTAQFDPQWQSRGAEYLSTLGHGMRVCYANMSAHHKEGDEPSTIARIEMPEWCANEMDTMLAIMQRHAIMGASYPLCLKAAHEAAVITLSDQNEVDQAILHQLSQQGLLLDTSAKQSAKNLR
jgi:hypothetical protein